LYLTFFCRNVAEPWLLAIIFLATKSSATKAFVEQLKHDIEQDDLASSPSEPSNLNEPPERHVSHREMQCGSYLVT